VRSAASNHTLDDAIIYLVPVGGERFELYSEPRDDSVPDGAAQPHPFWRRSIHVLHERWRQWVQAARHADPQAGRLARARDWAVRRTAETISEQRTLWALRHSRRASLVHPADRSPDECAAARDRVLAHARTHHGRWLVVDAVILAATGVFVIVPGPNILAYYFAFRLVGHYFSWMGARQALVGTAWQLRAEPALTELGRLADLPRDARASRVDAIAAGLNLPRLAAFFDRTAVPAR
jgi:K+-H+ exchange-related protein